MQHLMRESITCSLKLGEEKIGCKLSNSVPTVNSPHVVFLHMPREWELWSLFGTKIPTPPAALKSTHTHLSVVFKGS